MIGQSLRRGFGGLVTFAGRDRPRDFWPYAGVVLGTTVAVYMAALVALFAGTFAKMQRFAAEHPDQAVVEQGPGHYSISIQGYHPELMPDFGQETGFVAAIVALMTVLLAAAIVRRLHDSDMRGWIALVPLVLVIAGLWQMDGLFAAMRDGSEPDFGALARALATNLAYLASLAGLVFLLVRSGTPGANRFGEPREG